MRNLLLLSNSTNHGQGYLDHAISEVRGLLGTARRLVFVPFALHDRAAYVAKARARFATEGLEVDELTANAVGRRLLGSAEAVFVGGGNTFRLLDALQRSTLLHVVRERVIAGMPYLGASAGTNIAAPTIRTTNDMPIVQPASFEALSLVPFQINPHYTEARLRHHGGESRVDRLREFCTANPTVPVVALREGSWLEVEGEAAVLRGPKRALIYLGESRRSVAPGERVGGPERSNG